MFWLLYCIRRQCLRPNTWPQHPQLPILHLHPVYKNHPCITGSGSAGMVYAEHFFTIWRVGYTVMTGTAYRTCLLQYSFAIQDYWPLW